MTLADLVKQLRERAWSLGSTRPAPETRALVARLVDRAMHPIPLTPEQIALEQILDALRAPERASELPDRIVDQLSAQSVLELEALIDQVERGLVTPGQISDALRRARLHAVPPEC